MIFSEDATGFSLDATPLKSEEQLKNGLWLTLVGINETPPHIAFISNGSYYSLSARKVDCGSSLSRFLNVLERRYIPILFVHILTDKVIAGNEAISVNLLVEKIYKDLYPLENTENTCLSPIKALFSEYYSDEFSNVNYVFELLALAEKKGLIKECASLFCGDANSNIVTLPKYTMAQIKNKIQEISSLNNPTHAVH